MQRIATGKRPVPGENAVYMTITVNPLPDATPADFIRQLRGCADIQPLIVDIEDSGGGQVTVVLQSFELAKWTLQQAGQLPRFTHILPDSDD